VDSHFLYKYRKRSHKQWIPNKLVYAIRRCKAGPLSPFLFILSAELLANKIRKDPKIEVIKILENKLKLSQFADGKNLFWADLESVKEALKTVDEFGRLAGLALHVKKSKVMWLGKGVKNKSNPLNLKWKRSPVLVLGFMSRMMKKKTKN